LRQANTTNFTQRHQAKEKAFHEEGQTQYDHANTERYDQCIGNWNTENDQLKQDEVGHDQRHGLDLIYNLRLSIGAEHF